MAQSILVKGKEIRVKNTEMVIEDENRAEVVEFSIFNAGTIEGVNDMAFYVQYRNVLGEIGMDILTNAYPTEIIHNDMLVLDWLPSATFSKERGRVEIQIVGFTQSLEQTEDTKYQSGKLYFTSTGEFLPVYPSTSTHSPKVGDDISGPVYENVETGDDHRWSTEKTVLHLPENIYDNGTPIYTEAQVKSLITQIQGELSYAGINALKAEGFAVGEQNGTEVVSDSPYYHNNAKYYKEQAETSSESASDSATEASAYKIDAENARDKAEEWATKTNGKVDNIDYSAKHYAGEAGDYAEEADNARIVSVSETQSPDDGGTNVVTITYKDGTTFVFFVKNGSTGAPFTIYKTYSSIAEMNADFANVPEGRFVIISSSVSDPDNSKMFVRGAEAFTFVTDLSGAQGIQGPDGMAATITVGSVTSGSTASVTNVGTSSAAVFDFVLPKGDKGDQGVQGEQGVAGPTPVITIGSVTYGDTPTVTIDTTDPAHPVMDFVLKTSEVGVVDNLSSSSSVDALSARMGKDLQSQIVNVNSELDTLDAIVGGEAEVENTDPSEGQSILSSSRLIHHVNLLPSGEFGLVGARDIKWNQLAINGNFATGDMTGWTDASGGTRSVSNNKIAYSWTAQYSNNGLANDVSIIANHSYFITATVKNTSGETKGFRIGQPYGVQTATSAIENGATAIISGIIKPTTVEGNGYRFGMFGTQSGVSYSCEMTNFMVFDLTAMGMDTITASQFRALFPASFYPHDAGSIINLNPTGFSIRGLNIFDGQLEEGEYNATTGEKVASSSYLRNVNLIPVLPNTTYYLKAPLAFSAYYFDINAQKIGTGSPTLTKDHSFTTDASAYYMAFAFNKTGYGGLPFKDDIQIAFDSLPSSIKTVYHPFSGQTVPVSISGHYVNENCFDYVTNKVVDGVLRGEVHTRVGVVDLGSLTWTYWNATYGFYTTQLNSLMKLVSESATPNVLCALYSPTNLSGLASGDKCMALYNSDATRFLVKDSSYTDAVTFKTAMTGVYLLYELASETVTYTEPLRSFSLTDYATIEPITPQTIANRADVPFSVLSKSNNGLIQQIAQNTADIADNKAILSQHEARIANLEQVSGEYVTEEMQDYSTVPTGKASNALVETLKGVSRVENQLVNKTALSTATINGITFTNNGDGSWTISGTATAETYVILVSSSRISANHKYLFGIIGSTNVYLWQYGYDANKTNSYSIQNNNSDNPFGFLISNGTVFSTPETVTPFISDLTTYFNGNIPSNAQTIAGIQQNYPELLEPRDYTAGEIVDSTYTKVESVGVNIYDEQWELGSIGADGSNTPTSDQIRSKNYMRVAPSTAYYVKVPSVGLQIFQYDINKNYIRRDFYSSDSSFTTSANCAYLRFRTGSTLTTYQNNIQICLNSYADKTTYHPHMENTLTLPSPVTLRSAGSAHDEYDVESGEGTVITILADLGDFTWAKSSAITNGFVAISGIPSAMKGAANDSSVINAICSKGYECKSYAILVNNTSPDMAMSFRATPNLGIVIVDSTFSSYYSSFDADTFKVAVTGIKIVVERASADIIQKTPVIDNTLKTEGGGTVFTDAEVDGAFTLGFLNL